MSYIDQKYLNLVSPMLPLFKKKGDNLWNFRCPYCGDSQKSRTKARGYVFRKKNIAKVSRLITQNRSSSSMRQFLRRIYLNHFDPFRNWPPPIRREDWLKREEYRNSFSPTIYTYVTHFINSQIR